MDLEPAHGARCPLIACERGSSGSIGSKGSKGVGAAPDPSTQFSLFRLYIFKHPTFHSAQDDKMRRRGLKLAAFQSLVTSHQLLIVPNP